MRASLSSSDPQSFPSNIRVTSHTLACSERRLVLLPNVFLECGTLFKTKKACNMFLLYCCHLFV